MALFNKKNAVEGNPGELNAFLGVGTEYRGKLDFVGTVRIDGSFEGEISTDGTLVLGREACIKGTVRVGELSSCGKILGDVAVKGKAVLQNTSVLEGSLVAEKLVVEQGALLQGNISMSGGFVKTAVPSVDNVVRAEFAPVVEFADEFPEETEEQQAEAAGGVN